MCLLMEFNLGVRMRKGKNEKRKIMGGWIVYGQGEITAKKSHSSKNCPNWKLEKIIYK